MEPASKASKRDVSEDEAPGIFHGIFISNGRLPKKSPRFGTWSMLVLFFIYLTLIFPCKSLCIGITQGIFQPAMFDKWKVSLLSLPYLVSCGDAQIRNSQGLGSSTDFNIVNRIFIFCLYVPLLFSG